MQARSSDSTETVLSHFLVDHVERFLDRHGVLDRNRSILVAFSGGSDSTALLWALARLAEHDGPAVRAAHLDHGLDPASAERAEHAGAIAKELEIPYMAERREIEPLRRAGESLEAAARRVRYAYLRSCLGSCGADWIAVGHHRDDQIETILLRLLYGSGVIGLGGMRPVFGDVLRPLLELDRASLKLAVDEVGLVPVEDPGNIDLRHPRNVIRHRLLPRLRSDAGFSTDSLLRAASAARRTSDRLLKRLARKLEIEPNPTGGGSRLDLPALRRLPQSLRPYALDALRRAAGAPYSAPATAQHELDRQLARGGVVGCDCGAGWTWRNSDDRLELRRRSPGGVPEFSYTLCVPGEVSIPELGLTLRMVESKPAPWMFRGSKSRAAMSLPLEAGQQVLIRNRRPGDRLRPLGCSYRRKLKDILIDRRVERNLRDSVPLLIVDDRIAWVPGVTIADEFRLEGSERTWLAELTPSTATSH
ncbi:MAG: tRNA lysidine(34) synthetase TilS [Acidobacteria bacterium]|nr:tRNA lysidine(34) synthetase TilS [Acidobacteriota bacterium]